MVADEYSEILYILYINELKLKNLRSLTSTQPDTLGVFHLCTLQCETLEVNTQSIYLGVVLSNNLSLEHEPIAATNKPSTILGVLRIQLRENNSRAWLTVYNSLIRLKYYWFTALSQRHLKQKKSFERIRKKRLQ